MVGTVLQDTDGQFIGLTVAEDIAFVLENDCMAQEEMFRKVDGVAETVEVKELLHHAPSEMSGGQKQRVSMAGVMIDDVDILLFDEPLANLDPATGKKAIALIDRIQKEQKKTIVIIEHRLEDVLYKDVDRIVVVGEGTIVADMKPDDLLAGNILKEQGIREPLYVTALKHAGCTIAAEDHPQHVETMNFEPYRAQVREWFETTKIPQKQEAEEKVLNVDHLHFSYRPGKAILSDISFDVKKGEMISIVGKNGAGKTTIFNMLTGVYKPTDGIIKLDGEDLVGKKTIEINKAGIARTFQNIRLFSQQSVLDNVKIGLHNQYKYSTLTGILRLPKYRKMERKMNEKAMELLKVFELDDKADFLASNLPYGEQRKLEIARALATNPKLLLLDEPAAGMNPNETIELMDTIRFVRDNFDMTVLLIEHDMKLVSGICEELTVLNFGQVLAQGKTKDVLNNPEVIKAYLGE